MINASIASAEIAPVRIRGNRVVASPAATLPDRFSGLGPFVVVPAAKCGPASVLPQVVDSLGRGWGVFANEQLARNTAARLSR